MFDDRVTLPGGECHRLNEEKWLRDKILLDFFFVPSSDWTRNRILLFGRLIGHDVWLRNSYWIMSPIDWSKSMGCFQICHEYRSKPSILKGLQSPRFQGEKSIGITWLNRRNEINENSLPSTFPRWQLIPVIYSCLTSTKANQATKYENHLNEFCIDLNKWIVCRLIVQFVVAQPQIKITN